MRALLLVAHGSRWATSNDEVQQLAAAIAGKAGGRFEYVRAAFLELAQPLIPEGIQQCIDAGATEVLVYPYFLAAGRHVVTDVPEQVAIKQRQYPQYKIEIAHHLGSAEGLASLILANTPL